MSKTSYKTGNVSFATPVRRKCASTIVNFQCLWHTHARTHNFLLSLPLWLTASEFSLNLKSSIRACMGVGGGCMCHCMLYRYRIRRASILVYGTNLSSKILIRFHPALVGIKKKSTQWIRSVLFYSFGTWISELKSILWHICY